MLSSMKWWRMNQINIQKQEWGIIKIEKNKTQNTKKKKQEKNKQLFSLKYHSILAMRTDYNNWIGNILHIKVLLNPQACFRGPMYPPGGSVQPLLKEGNSSRHSTNWLHIASGNTPAAPYQNLSLRFLSFYPLFGSFSFKHSNSFPRHFHFEFGLRWHGIPR